MGLPNINTRLGSSWIITSVVPRSDDSVYRVINQTLWNNFQDDTLVFDLAGQGELAPDEVPGTNPGVILTRAEFVNYEWTPTALWDIVEQVRQLILSGEIVVEETWTPP